MMHLLKNELTSVESISALDSYLQKTQAPSKWILLTDYCLDAPDKANVITFVLIHFKNEKMHSRLEQTILKLQKSDIKHTRYISNRLMRYLRKLPIFSFSFIVDNREVLFGDTIEEQKKKINEILEEYKSCHQKWISTAADTDIKNYYQDTVNKLDKQIKLVSQGKNVKLLEDIILTTSLGSFYTSEMLKRVPKLDVFGWFPDRDKITQSCDEIANPLFHCMFHNCMDGREIIYAPADPNIAGSPFYDALNRIPDDICAAIADYDFSSPSISKEKFSHVLHVLMAKNPFVRVYRLYKDATGMHISSIHYKTNLRLTVLFYTQTVLRDVSGFIKKVKNICRNSFLEDKV